MRITGGIARSIQLKTLDLPELRPATDAMRQAIFNSVVATMTSSIEGSRFLDLFAGSGAYGLEAISRGATSGVFVERHPKLVKVIEENRARVCKSAGVEEKSFLVRQADALKFSSEPNSFDLVFCDPPYAMIEEISPVLFAIASQALKKGGLFLLEHPSGMKLKETNDLQFVKNIGGKTNRAPNVGVFVKNS
jgi:16S rRNA (guanine966-N2)-methyltransferase